jgi:hypothetical protein
VGDEVLSRLAPLVGVALAGEGEGVLDRAAVEAAVLAVGAVLADDREQVAEQGAILRGQVPRDRVDRRRRTMARAADSRVAAPVGRPRGAVARFELP